MSKKLRTGLLALLVVGGAAVPSVALADEPPAGTPSLTSEQRACMRAELSALRAERPSRRERAVNRIEERRENRGSSRVERREERRARHQERADRRSGHRDAVRAAAERCGVTLPAQPAG